MSATAKPPVNDDPAPDDDPSPGEAGKPQPADAVQTVRKAADVLDIVAAAGGEGVRLTDVVAKAGLGKSTAYRLLTALVQAGLLDQDPVTRIYFLGFKLVGLGEIAANRLGLGDLGLDVVEEIAARTQDTVYLSARAGNQAVCLARVSGNHPIKIFAMDVGDRSPLGAGAGSIALLAALPEPEMRRIVRDNARLARQHPGLEENALLATLDQARKQGYVRTDGRVVEGISAIAVPVVASNGLPIAAISLATITDRLPPRRESELVDFLRDHAQRLAERIEDTLGSLSRRMIRRVVAAARK
ncbi:MAG: IclR family transcriptional regulator [Rhodospirillaceae bacterium]|nr:IclR family transcriptional regulator [Rhodospirillaceae bacterium]